MKKLVATLAVVLAAWSCGGEEPEGDDPIIILNNGTSGPNNGSPANGAPNNGSPNNSLLNNSANNVPVTADTYPVVALLRLGPALADDADTLLRNVVEAVWFASEWVGEPTTTGTITQQGSNYTYSAGPADRLVVNVQGRSFEVVIRAFDGYQELTWVEFAEANATDFTVSSGSDFELRIVNNSRFWDDCTDAVYRTCYRWERTISGKATFAGKPVQVDFADSGRTRYSVEGDFANYETDRDISGTASTADESFSVQSGYSSELAHSRPSAQQSRNFAVSSAGTAQGGGHSLSLADVYVQWEDVSSLTNPGVSPLVNQPSYWEARGTVLRDEATWGTVQFDGPVTPNTPGPAVVLALTDGSTLPLFRPIE